MRVRPKARSLEPEAVPYSGHDRNASNRDRLQAGLRARGPVFVVNLDRFCKKMDAEGRRKRARRGVASGAAREKGAQLLVVFVLLDGGRLEIVELGDDKVLQLRIAARHMNVERGPGFTQKYL